MTQTVLPAPASKRQPKDVHLVRLADVSTTFDWLPRQITGRPYVFSTFYRWALRGRLIAGRRVYLKTESIGGVLFTSEAWLREFFTALVGGDAQISQ